LPLALSPGERDLAGVRQFKTRTTSIQTFSSSGSYAFSLYSNPRSFYNIMIKKEENSTKKPHPKGWGYQNNLISVIV
jgi:hypothetical protein